MGLKRCSACKKILTLDSFYLINRNDTAKYTTRCIDCISEYKNRNIERQRKYGRDYYHRHRSEIILKNKKSNKKRKKRNKSNKTNDKTYTFYDIKSFCKK